MVARAGPRGRWTELGKLRMPVRLGHHAFTRKIIDRDTLDRAVQAFQAFASLFHGYRVGRYRAVATSAIREARNRNQLLAHIREETGIHLETIPGEEEARLIRTAVWERLGSALEPSMIIDLGGGSLEINLLRGRRLLHCATLPLGTVRLLETFDVGGRISGSEFRQIRRRVISVLRRNVSSRNDMSVAQVAVCGGNAEMLVRLAEAMPVGGIPTMDMNLLEDRLEDMLELGIVGRMKAFGVSRNRAEVMGVAAVVLTTLAQWMKVNLMLVPGVGVKEGILCDLARASSKKGLKWK